jgi:arylsulfatase A
MLLSLWLTDYLLETTLGPVPRPKQCRDKAMVSTFPKLAFRAVPLLLGLCCPPADAADAPRPNVIILLADDMGYAELGCYGQRLIKTPHIDRLAAEGLRFTQFYSGNAVCAPSRCCLMTGKHPGHAYTRDNGDPKGALAQFIREKYDTQFVGQNPIPDGEVTLAEVLKARAYATAAIGKWGLGHFGTTGDPNTQGFDLFYGYNCQGHAHNHYPRYLWRNSKKEMLPGNDSAPQGKTYSQDRFIEEALAFIRQQKDRPFFLYLPFTIPHVSIQVPEESLAEYKGKLPEAPHSDKSAYVKHPMPRAGYAAMISHLDRGIGQIMKLVKDLGLDERTLVIFSSDNGPTHGRVGGSDSEFFRSAGPFRGLKGSLYEGGIRVPMIARWPGKIAPGGVSEHVGAFWDVLPTIAEVTGATPPKEIDGISFVPTLLGREPEQKRHDYLYWEFPSYGGQQAVRLGDWKAVRQGMLRKGNKDPLRIELYDLKTDIGEQRDLAAQHPEMVAKARDIMRTAHEPSKLFPLAPIDVP